MANKFIIICAVALLTQAVAGHIIPLPQPVSGSAAASSAASAAASTTSKAASAAAASAAATRTIGAGSAAASSAASATSVRNAAAANIVTAGRSAASSASASASASRAAAAAKARSVGGTILDLADYDIIYSEPLLVTSTSGIYPTGLSVSSDVGLNGPMYVYGSLPFLSAVGFEGSLATDGSGVATCGCASGNVGITNEI